jgi:post-segregation antitoxin (ccd killing protein)
MSRNTRPTAYGSTKWPALDVNTNCIYSRAMASRLLNVRLAPEDERLAQELRARGVSISDVVRRAIRSEARRVKAEPLAVDGLLEDIIARYPTPNAPARKRPDAADRRAVGAHIRARLRTKR